MTGLLAAGSILRLLSRLIRATRWLGLTAAAATASTAATLALSVRLLPRLIRLAASLAATALSLCRLFCHIPFQLFCANANAVRSIKYAADVKIGRFESGAGSGANVRSRNTAPGDGGGWTGRSRQASDAKLGGTKHQLRRKPKPRIRVIDATPADDPRGLRSKQRERSARVGA